MDTASTTKDHVSYVYSKEVILKRLLENGQITGTEFERYDRLLYDRYHIDARLGVPRPIADTPDQSDGAVTTVNSTSEWETYASLTEAVREIRDDNPGYVIQSWLRDSNTPALLKIWELKHNPDFNSEGYDRLLSEMRSSPTTLTVKKWIDCTNAVGIQSRAGRNGGTYAHPEILCAFMAWLRPEFQYKLIQSFMAAGGVSGSGIHE